MQSIHLPAISRPAVGFLANGRVRSVRADTSVEVVAAVLTNHQLKSVPVVDEYGVPVGVISLADLLTTDDGDPIFAGLTRRRWYALPAGATAADLMSRAAPEIELAIRGAA